MRWSSWCWWLLALFLAQVFTVAAFGPLSWQGIAPNLVLIVAAVAGLRHGASAGLVVGFLGGVLLDLAPPADHIAGRWALALLVVGYVAGRMRPPSDPLAGPFAGARDSRGPAVPLPQLVVAVGAGSFIGTSVFALSGLVLGETTLAIPDLLWVTGLGALVDAAGAVAVVAAYRLLARLVRRRSEIARPSPERVVT